MRTEERGRRAAVAVGAAGAALVGILLLARTRAGNRAVGKAQAQLDKVREGAARRAGQGVDRYIGEIRGASRDTQVPVPVIIATGMNESAWNNSSRGAARANPPKCGTASWDGGNGCWTAIPDRSGCTTDCNCAIGLMQIKPTTARGEGFTGPPVGLCDPRENLRRAVAYLRTLQRKYSNAALRKNGDDLWAAVWNAYRCGPGAYDAQNACATGAGVRYAARAETHRVAAERRYGTALSGVPAAPLSGGFRFMSAG